MPSASFCLIDPLIIRSSDRSLVATTTTTTGSVEGVISAAACEQAEQRRAIDIDDGKWP